MYSYYLYFILVSQKKKVYQVKNKDKVRRSNSQSSLSIEKIELKEGWYFLIKGVKEKISRYIF